MLQSSKKLKLCYIANANSIHSRRWIAPFVQMGHDVHLLSYKSIEQPFDKVKLVDLTKLSNTRKLRWLYWGWWIRHYIQELQPDILHAHQLQAAGWLGMLASYHPFIVSGWGSDILLEPHKSPLRRLLISLVLRQCDRLTVPSQFMYDVAKALEVPDGRLCLIPWGIETDVFQLQPDDRLATRNRFSFDGKAKIVFCPRRIAPIYNIDVVLESIKAIVHQNPDLRLLLLRYNVDPDYISRIKQIISTNDLQDHVRWLPPQKTPSDMACLYRMSDVVISIPSSEGFGFTVYEAMASGCPTLISDLPVFGDLVDGVHTMKAPVRDVSVTSQRLANLFANEDLRQELRRNAITIVQNNSIANRVEQAATLYNELGMIS